MQVIYLDDSDTLNTLRVRLNWSDDERILIVLPSASKSGIYDQLDIEFMRRLGIEHQKQLGIVSTHPKIVDAARNARIPVFPFVWQARIAAFLRLWRKTKVREYPGRPTKLTEEDRIEVERRLTPRPVWQQWLSRYMSMVAFIFALAALALTVIYLVPQATISLRPETETLLISEQFIADRTLTEPDREAKQIPARLVLTLETVRLEADTTGRIGVPVTSARGEVVFVNLSTDALVVPAGTRVFSSGTIRREYQTVQPITVPRGVNEKAVATVVAIEPGEASNIGTNRITGIDGPLALKLSVGNISGIGGGEDEIREAVSQGDMDRLRQRVINQIMSQAFAELSGELEDGELLPEGALRIVAIYGETYTHFRDEATPTLELEIQAEVHGTAVSREVANDILKESLVARVQEGFSLEEDTVTIRSGDILDIDAQGRVTFAMQAEAISIAELNTEITEDLIAQTKGQEPALAMRYLYEQMPLLEEPRVDIWPEYMTRMPYLQVRISKEILVE